MKKTYFTPEVQTDVLAAEQVLCTSPVGSGAGDFTYSDWTDFFPTL